MNIEPLSASGRLRSGTRAADEQETNPHRRISINSVCDLCGGVSHMTIWRWQQDESLGFPKPVYIARRRYWREAEIQAWLEARAEAA